MQTTAQQELYRTQPETRMRFGQNAAAAAAYYDDFVNFVRAVAPPGAGLDLLDAGCGCGWSTFGFAAAGYRATGVDLNPAAFEPPAAAGLTLREASALDLPFADASFDVVAAYQCLEHLPDPRAALDSLLRVLRPGGVIAIVGPNLVSPFAGAAVLLRELLGGRPLWRRLGATQRHPYGNTVGERAVKIAAIAALLASKLLDPEPSFTLRAPDSTPPFHGDNDAGYLCNPTDLIKFFRRQGLVVLRKGRPGRPPLSHLCAGGTWVAARRPAAPPGFAPPSPPR
jgi:SAM-dependent methyltransferase